MNYQSETLILIRDCKFCQKGYPSNELSMNHIRIRKQISDKKPPRPLVS